MKIAIIEKWVEMKDHKVVGVPENPIWKGEAETISIRTHPENTTIRQPDIILINGDSITVMYPQNSNVRIEEEKKDKYSHTLYCKPAMTSEELEKLKAEREETEEKREEILA